MIGLLRINVPRGRQQGWSGTVQRRFARAGRRGV